LVTTPEGKELYKGLKQIRLEIANGLNIPPYMIFHDKSLLETSEKKPPSYEDMRNISGVGESKLAKFGEAFMNVIREHNLKILEQNYKS